MEYDLNILKYLVVFYTSSFLLNRNKLFSIVKMNTCVTPNNGVKMTVVGFDLWALYSNECIQCVKEAIEVGYSHFDTAQDIEMKKKSEKE